MLGWFVGPETANIAESETVVLKEDVIDTSPNLISSACTNKLVNLALDKCLMKMNGKPFQ